ncbi:hypothetical protein J421_6175 (plasmid) [Gemmatirosa kalamazoonensis]|uniref:Uncharacterized protein n=1 Tax=Gemmatirosa kalamazoonensis TaxID=861299 RepID=W0RTU8_9BACT|nr:hypothetical protein [Gemmatirosa kalamazoonensis]AHG93710.1 hypothetical protein J421_6175 [Gemmatirosa kalamazoonensis]
MMEDTLQHGRAHPAGQSEPRAPEGTPSRRAAAGAARDPKPRSSPRRESRTLAVAREAFVAAIARDTPGTDRPRFVKVIDALIAWSVARSTALRFRTDEKRNDVLAFELAETGEVFWSALAVRGASPTLEVHMPAGRERSAEDRRTVMETLNAHSRGVLVEGDRLRIGFGALKNDGARAAVLDAMQKLLVKGASGAA